MGKIVLQDKNGNKVTISTQLGLQLKPHTGNVGPVVVKECQVVSIDPDPGVSEQENTENKVGDVINQTETG
jgi:hypothetical protein